MRMDLVKCSDWKNLILSGIYGRLDLSCNIVEIYEEEVAQISVSSNLRIAVDIFKFLRKIPKSRLPVFRSFFFFFLLGTLYIHY